MGSKFDYHRTTIELFEHVSNCKISLEGAASAIFTSHHSMSNDKCLFSILPLSFECAKAIQLPCDGQLEKLTSLNGVYQTFECEHVIDLLLIRGGIAVDWSDGNKANELLDMFVCSNHKSKLLTSWNINKFANKFNNRNQRTCSLHKILHVQGTKPVSYRTLSKSNALRLIEATGRFFHVGTGICKQHHEAICGLKYELLSFSDQIGIAKDSNQNDVDQPDDNLARFDSPFDDSESQLDSQSVYAPSLHDDSDQETLQSNPEDKRSTALREIAALFGLSRLTSERNWTSLKPETRKKKVSSMLHLQNELFKLCAGSEWETMKTECIRKTGQIVDSFRVTAILQSIGERLEETTDRRAKLSLVSILTGHFTEREIIHATGVSRYFVREAKKYALYGLDEVAKFRRVKYNLPILKQFIGFISLPDIIVYLPNPARSFTLSSGDSVSMATVARLHSYRQVVDMYKKFIEEKGIKECAATGMDVQEFVRVNSFGYSTCIKLMKIVLPSRRVRMQCVDLFQSEALEAFGNSLKCVSELKEKGKIGQTEASDLQRRFQVAQNYLTGYYRRHLSMSSTCSTHCIRFALTDKSNPGFSSPCDHDHEDSCEQCNDILSVFAQFRSFLKAKADEAHSNNDVYRFRLSRLLEECVESETRVMDYQRHIVRAALSDLDRISAMESLTDSWCLITMDFSLKLMPSGFIESQSQWFGKSGISFHISHCLISKGGTRFHHTFGHLNDEWKQDSTAICIIGDHVFKTLAENGVKNIILRSDNAGSYRNAAVVHTLHITAANYGIRLVAYLFSEPQYGKGAADRQISHSKRKLVDEVDKGGYGRTAEEILKSLCTEPLLKSFSFYTINGNQVKRAEGTIPDITMLSSFRYEKEGIRVRKFDTIGGGVLLSYDKMEGVEVNYEVNSSGGHLSMSSSFWGELSETTAKTKESKVSNEETEEEETDKKFRCTEGNCTMKYLTINGLSKHMLVGKHKERKHTDTIIDAAAKIFSETVETNETAYLSMMNDSFASSLSHVRSLKLTEGWSLRVKRKNIAIDPDVRCLVRKYFVGRRKEGKRAEARFVVGMLREKTEADGSLRLSLGEVETSKKGLAALESDGEEAIEDEEREEGNDVEGEVIDVLDSKSVKKGRGRPKKTELTTGPNQTFRKVKRSVSKKAGGRSPKILLSESDSDEAEGDGDNEEEITVESTVNKKETTAKRRGRPPKKSIEEAVIDKKKGKGRKKKDDATNTSVTSSSTRVLRDRKRKSGEEKIDYQEISSADELDDYTLMMNTVMDEENFNEIFSEEE